MIKYNKNINVKILLQDDDDDTKKDFDLIPSKLKINREIAMKKLLEEIIMFWIKIALII